MQQRPHPTVKGSKFTQGVFADSHGRECDTYSSYTVFAEYGALVVVFGEIVVIPKLVQSLISQLTTTAKQVR